MQDPIEKFNQCWAQARENSPLNQKSAICVTTIDAQGYPSSRFVDLKFASAEGFIFCTHLSSAKAQDIQANPKGSMCIWWDHRGLQVRLKGTLAPISATQAHIYWAERGKEAQLTSLSFMQSHPLADETHLAQTLQNSQAQYQNSAVPRPLNWGGFQLLPHEMEFLTFQESRLHLREQYLRTHHSNWTYGLLQP